MAQLYKECLNFEIKSIQARMRQLKEDKSIPVSEMNIRYEALAKELKALKRHRTVMEEAEQNRWNG